MKTGIAESVAFSLTQDAPASIATYEGVQYGARSFSILRHSKIAVTMEIYTEVPSAATRDALRRLSDWLT